MLLMVKFQDILNIVGKIKYISMLNNLLNILRNGFKNKLKFIYCKKTNQNIKILTILQENLIILGFEIQHKKIKIYPNLKIKKIVFILISKPNNKIYISIKKLQLLNNSYEFSVISTTKGFISNIKAKTLNIGGEFLFKVKWK